MGKKENGGWTTGLLNKTTYFIKLLVADPKASCKTLSHRTS